MSASTYSVPTEAKELFLKGLLENPLLVEKLPKEAAECAVRISFEGTQKPSIPINWRFAESVSALKALEATFVNSLAKRKYGVEAPRVAINTDHACLFFISCLIYSIDPEGQNLKFQDQYTEASRKMFPDYDNFDAQADVYRLAATNIHRTSDGRYYHIHGSLNPSPTIECLGLPLYKAVANKAEAVQLFTEAVAKKTAAEWDTLVNDKYRQAGTVCWTKEEFAASEHGQANAHVGLYEVTAYPRTCSSSTAQAPGWWPDAPETSEKRPLAGLKVVDLTRIIAAPAIARGLAELGASVMRVTCARLPDMAALHVDLNWGKWNTSLDFAVEADRETLKQLIRDADVVVTGYRPGVLDKFGLGLDGILRLVEDRDRGIILVRENCYGWHGPWKGRSGWQQISDACCGVSMEFGRAMGHDEAVTPVFPNSDYCTGICGVIGTLDALLRRAEAGGSYRVDAALNYYSQWLVKSCGMYPDDVWQDLWARNGKPVYRHYNNMNDTLGWLTRLLVEKHSATLFRPAFFEDRPCPNLGCDIRTVRPILRYPDGEVELKYNVGTRTNGVDKPYWPKNLLTQVVE